MSKIKNKMTYKEYITKYNALWYRAEKVDRLEAIKILEKISKLKKLFLNKEN